MMTLRCGVAANPGQNGHIYLEIAPNNNGGAAPVTGWKIVDYVACRNNQTTPTGTPGIVAGDAAAVIGSGRGLICYLPNLYWYRLRTQTITQYAAPTFITDGSTNWGHFYTFP